MKFVIFTAVKNRCILHRRVFVMTLKEISNDRELVKSEPNPALETKIGNK